MAERRIVIMESPYAGDVERNLDYARACLLDCIRKDEAPFASHLLYTQVLDDALPHERAEGIDAGLAFAQVAHATVVYVDLGITDGMKRGIDNAHDWRIPVEYRTLEVWQR